MSSPESAAHDDGDGDDIKEQDRLLPIANVARIMKQAVPSNAKIAKDAKETVQECVSEFIAFITSEYHASLSSFCQSFNRASDRCQQEKRKTINGEDIVWAMEALGFDQYGQLMKLYLQKYKEVTKVEKGHHADFSYETNGTF
jgi:histone H3/H4